MSRKSVREMRMSESETFGNGGFKERREGGKEGRPGLRRWGLRVIHRMN